MKLTLAEPKYLKDSISIISDLVTEGRFKIGVNGIEMAAMDPANVAMVVFKLLSSAFVEYNVPEEVTIGINLSNLKQILRRAKPADAVSLELEGNKLVITFSSTTKRTFSLSILEVDEKEQRIPDLTFPVTVKTTSTVLNEAVEDADIVADAVSLIAEKDTLTLQAEGDLTKAKIEIHPTAETTIFVDGTNPIRAKYSLEYLKKMISGSKLSDSVSLHFNKDYPLKLEYKVVDKVLLSFILAPRVEND